MRATSIVGSGGETTRAHHGHHFRQLRQESGFASSKGRVALLEKAALTSSAGQSHNMSSSWFLGRDSIEEMLSDKVSHGWWQHHLLDEEDVGEIYHHR